MSDIFDELIEYSPETPFNVVSDCELEKQISGNNENLPVVEVVSDFVQNNLNNDCDRIPTKIVYVCSLCMRQYVLVQDLRGHMMEYHNYVETTAGSGAPSAKKPELRDAATQIHEEKLNASTNVALSAATAPAAATVEMEMRPVPFKDFRLILRAPMTLRCTVTFSCPYKFENSTKLEMHAKCHIDAKTSQKFKCFECGLEISNWRHCSAHFWKQHQIDIDLLHCPMCDFKAHASGNHLEMLVWRHMRAHKKWRPRVLHSLRAVQQRRQQNLQNVIEHKPPPPPPQNKNKYYSEKTCDICNRKFVNGKTLSKHVKAVHNKIKPFICNVCGKKTARKASLIIHMRQHTGEKPLQCKSCKFSTRDPSVLHKHQLRHEKVGKFKCKLCTYTCIQTNAYKRHIRLNHPEVYKEIACDLCTYVTITAEKLQAHKEDHRKGLVVTCEDSMDAMHSGGKNQRKFHDKNNEISADCFLPLESIDSLPHEPAVDTGGVTIPAPSEDTQFPTYLNN